MSVKFDEIGYWSEIKLEIIEKYAQAYSQILSNQSWSHHVYVDAFAGAGTHFSKTTKTIVRGSPLIALDIAPPFREYFFIDIDREKVTELRRIALDHPRGKLVHILEGDCNTALINYIYPRIRKSNTRSLCLLDPYGLNLNWDVIEAAGKMGTVEIFLNFPVMDINRNALLTNPQKSNPEQLKRMDTFWGDHSWNDIAYQTIQDMFGEHHGIKQDISNITSAFQRRLHEKAEFQYVPEPIPMRNSRRGLLYYLFFASNNRTGGKIINEIFTKYRERGMR